MVTSCFRHENPNMIGEVNAIVRYGSNNNNSDSQKSTPTSLNWDEAILLQCRDMNTTELVPIREVTAPEPDAFFYLRMNFEIGRYRLSRGFFNGSTWRPNVHSPTLNRAIEGLRADDPDFNTSISTNDPSVYGNDRGSAFVNNAAFDSSSGMVIQTSGIQTIDVLIVNYEDQNHPLHLHGYKYFVLAQGHALPARLDNTRGMDRENLTPFYDSLNLTNPLRRDTANVQGYGWTLIRFVADNPGAWPLHCHIAWHTEAGLLMQFITRTDMIAEIELPEANKALCLAEGLEKGAAPKDEDYREEAQNVKTDVVVMGSPDD